MIVFEKNLEKSIFSLSSDELNELKKLLKSKSENEKLVAQGKIENLLSPLIGAFNFDIYNPPWLYQSKFEDDIWYIKSVKTIKEINFQEVILNNNIRLNELPELLNTFKLWLSLATSPTLNNGTLIKKNTNLQIINQILTLIDCIILDADHINLSGRKLLALNNNYFTEKLIKITLEGVEVGAYNYLENVKNYLLKNIKNISLEEIKEFEKEYPHKENEGEKILNLSSLEIRKSKVYLFKNKAYKVALSNKISVNSGYFHKIYNGTLAFKNMKFPLLEELNLEPIAIKKEYKQVPTKKININLGNSRISTYIKSINILNNVFLILIKKYNYLNYSNININISSIQNFSININKGRFTTLPSNVVFKAFRDAFNYLYKNQDHLLKSFINILTNYNLIKKNNLKGFKTTEFLIYLMPETKKSGISQWSIERNQNFFSELRKDKSLSHAYYILIASCSIVIGTVMARRQSEIIDLDPFDSLHPNNIDPSKNKNIEYYLKIKNNKSGVGGNHDLKEVLTLPVPHSIAIIIYKLQIFNKQLNSKKLIDPNKIKLINTFNKHNLKIQSMNQSTYNYYLDYFCDFFETETINLEENEKSRFYIRQHQLRRFFAMLFFWSNSFDGLDTLTKFLGHTNPKHIYNYITESTPGEVLNGVKARYIFENYNLEKNNELYIQNIEKLEPLLKKYFNVSTIDLMAEKDVFQNYNNEINKDYLAQSKSLEEYFFVLLCNHTIDLKPDFFTVKDKNNNSKYRDFKLILVIKE